MVFLLYSMPPTFWTIAVPSFLLMVRSAVLMDVDKKIQLCSFRRENSKDLTNSKLNRIPSNLPDDTENLDVSENNISSIVREDLYRLPRLCFLKITHCGLRFISHDAFFSNSELKVLNISYNPLTFIPYMPLLQLRILDLSANAYESYRLPAFFSSLTYLTTFAIGSTKVTSAEIGDLAPLRNTSLKRFTFGSGTEIQKYEAGSFSHIRSLEEVSLRVTSRKVFRHLQTSKTFLSTRTPGSSGPTCNYCYYSCFGHHFLCVWRRLVHQNALGMDKSEAKEHQTDWQNQQTAPFITMHSFPTARTIAPGWTLN